MRVVFSTLMPRSNENKACMRVDGSLTGYYRANCSETSHQNLNQLR